MKTSAGSTLVETFSASVRDDLLHEAVEIGLGNMDRARRDRGDDPLADVDAMHADAAARDQRRGRQADVAKADDGNFGECGH